MSSPTNAGPSKSKKPRLSQGTTAALTDHDARMILRSAEEVTFPWAECMPQEISTWFSTISKAHNTLPEFVFVTALSTVACLMGPNTAISVRDTYVEPTNIFTVCMGPPGCGKSQAFRIAVLDPLSDIGAPMSEILVDDYTRRGLFNYLSLHENRALCAHEEMSALFDTIQKRQLELSGERQLYCRLYDAGKWSSVTGYKQQNDGKQQLDKACFCIAGFLQPLPFIQRSYPSLLEFNDGFVDRFLICSPRPKLLLEEEVEDWCTKLSAERLKSLAPVYKLVSLWHSNEMITYKFSDKAKEDYRLFANEMTRLMNSQFEDDDQNVFGNYSKDKRTVVRLCGIVHVLYEAMKHTMRQLQTTSSESDVIEESSQENPACAQEFIGQPKVEITQEEFQMAVALTEYFQNQRKAYDMAGELSKQSQTGVTQNIPKVVLLTKGAIITPRSVIKNMTTKYRPPPDKILSIMKSFEEKGLGYVKTISRNQNVFFKPTPSDENKEAVENVIGEEKWDTYVQQFGEIDEMYMTSSQYNRALDFADNIEELQSFGVNER